MTGKRSTMRDKAEGAGRRAQTKTAQTHADADPRSGAGQLSPLEEKVLRMRRGAAAPEDLVLGRVGQDRPEVARRLLEIETRALKESGRLDELRREALHATATAEAPGPLAHGARAAVKDKIVARLAERARRR